MEVDRPAPGEELNASGDTTVPRQAASVIVLRGGAERLELLLVQRTPQARFMGGFWVFPGGAVDAHEGEGDASHRRAAVRELEEEAGIGGIAPTDLVKFSQWITPRQIAIRYDTHFFLASVPDETQVVIDGDEIVDLAWFAPARALEAHAGGDLALVFPTIKHLEQLAPFASAAELIDYASGREVLPVEPRVIREGEIARVVLPGEPGYDDGPELTP
jgi:8-oxo-dGTP pyrophosphatase MutT (NUDIX family)